MNLKITNKRGQELDLLNNTDKFVLYKAEALHGIETDIATSESAYIDGVNIENVKALPRGIELTFILQGNIKESINFFTNIIKSKQVITLYEEEEGKELTIKGIATIPPYTRMIQSCEINLEIYCGNPYWEDLHQIIGAIASKIDMLYFPYEGQYFTQTGRVFGVVDTTLKKTFTNNGDTSVGMIIYITALGVVKNPQIGCSTGEQNGYYMRLNGLTLKENDEVEISTIKGNKYIKINGLDEYELTPVLSFLEFKGLDWLQLETGDNTFEVIADEGQEKLYFTIAYRRKYE